MPLTNGKNPKFDSPPVIEVAATIQFHDFPADIVITHFHKIADALGRLEYPNVELKNPRPKIQAGIQGPQFIFTTQEVFQPPMIWFTSADGVRLVQVQNDRVSFNWRRMPGDGSTTNYISFQNVFRHFDAAVRAVSTTLSSAVDQSMDVNRMELAYINSIPYADFEGAPNIHECLPWVDGAKIPEYAGKPSSLSFSWDIDCPDERSNMQIAANTSAIAATGEPTLMLSIAMRTPISSQFPSGFSAIQKWFDQSHKTIINTFADITTTKMHKLWGRTQ